MIKEHQMFNGSMLRKLNEKQHQHEVLFYFVQAYISFGSVVEFIRSVMNKKLIHAQYIETNNGL